MTDDEAKIWAEGEQVLFQTNEEDSEGDYPTYQFSLVEALKLEKQLKTAIESCYEYKINCMEEMVVSNSNEVAKLRMELSTRQRLS